jgi:hypothetical protein
MTISLAVLLLSGAPSVPVPPPVPTTVVVATSRGELSVPVRLDVGHASLSTQALARVLPVTFRVIEGWALVAFAGEPFRFLLGAPVKVHRDRVYPLAGGAYALGDTLFVPLQWLAEHVPRVFSEGYRYDAGRGRFEEMRVAVAGAASAPVPAAAGTRW